MVLRSLVFTVLACILSSRGIYSYMPKQCDIRFWHVGVVEQLLLQETEMTQQQEAMLDRVEKLMERVQKGATPLVPCTLLSTFGSIIVPDSGQHLLEETMKKREEVLTKRETDGNSDTSGKTSSNENRQDKNIEDSLNYESVAKENLRPVVEIGSRDDTSHNVHVTEGTHSSDKGERGHDGERSNQAKDSESIQENNIYRDNDETGTDFNGNEENQSNDQKDTTHTPVNSDSTEHSQSDNGKDHIETEMEHDNKPNNDITETELIDGAEEEKEMFVLDSFGNLIKEDKNSGGGSDVKAQATDKTSSTGNTEDDIPQSSSSFKGHEDKIDEANNMDVSQNGGVVIFYEDDDEAEEQNIKETDVPVLRNDQENTEHDSRETIRDVQGIDKAESENSNKLNMDDSDYRNEEITDLAPETDSEGLGATVFSHDSETLRDQVHEKDQDGENSHSDSISVDIFGEKIYNIYGQGKERSENDVKGANLETSLDVSDHVRLTPNKSDTITVNSQSVQDEDIFDNTFDNDDEMSSSGSNHVNTDDFLDFNKMEKNKEREKVDVNTSSTQDFQDFQSISHNSTLQICPSPFSDKCYPFSENDKKHENIDKWEILSSETMDRKSALNPLHNVHMTRCFKNVSLDSLTPYDTTCNYIFIQLFKCGVHDRNFHINTKSKPFEKLENTLESTINTGSQDIDAITSELKETDDIGDENNNKEGSVLHEKYSEDTDDGSIFNSGGVDDTSTDSKDHSLHERNAGDGERGDKGVIEEAQDSKDEMNSVNYENSDKEQIHQQEQQNSNREERNSEKIDMEKIELLLGKRESEQVARIQNLELMIVKLENKILAQNMEKQGDSNVFMNLENQILKLENELLKLNQSYQKLQDDHEDLRSRQRKHSSYLELDNLSSSPLKQKYPAIADNSSMELMTQQKTKISELARLIQNQTNFVQKLQSKSDYLEEQNQKLFQVVMNQTALISHIMNKLQELGDEHLQTKIQAEQFKSNLEKLKQTQLPQGLNVETKKKVDNLEQNQNVNSYDYAIDSSLRENPLPSPKSIVHDVLSVLKHSPTAESPTVKYSVANKDHAILRLCLFNRLIMSNYIPFNILYWLPCRPLPNSFFLGTEDTFKSEHSKASFNVNPPEDTANIQEPPSSKQTDIGSEDSQIRSDAESEELLTLRPISGYEDARLDDSKIENKEKANPNEHLLEGLRVQSGENEKNGGKDEDGLVHEGGDRDRKRDGEATIISSHSEPGTPLAPPLQVNVNEGKPELLCQGNDNSDECRNETTKGVNAAPSVTTVEQKSGEISSDVQETDDGTKSKTAEASEAGAGFIENKKKDVQTDEEAKGRKKAAEEAKTLHEALHRKILYEPLHEGRSKDCYELYKKGQRQSGMSKIFVSGLDVFVSVYCDMDNGGWTLLLKREDGQLDFYRSYEQYKDGFGAPRGEHYIGNEVVHYLTNQGHYSLRVDLDDWNGNSKHAHYAHFWVDGEEDGFRLHVSGYSGNAGDGLSKHGGMKFSTYDVDQDLLKADQLGGSCAKRFHGAGWYYKCYASNLMGYYYDGGNIPHKRYDGVAWKPWMGTEYSLKTAVLAVRPFGVES